MDNSVVIKGNKNGIVVILDDKESFDSIKEKVARKFSDSAKFLGNCKTAVAFQGRILSDDEKLELLEVIHSNSNLDIVCLLEDDAGRNSTFENAVNEKLLEYNGNTARFFKTMLRSGQSLEQEQSIVLIGDVNPGATVISNGNILILGSLKGTAIAGASGNTNAFVFAVDMNPMQVRIFDTIARSPDKQEKDSSHEPKIAFLEAGNIYIEPVTKSILNSLNID